MSLEDKAGQLFHSQIGRGPGGTLADADPAFGLPSTDNLVLGRRMTHFNLLWGVEDSRRVAQWHNRLVAQDHQWADLVARRIPNLIKDSFLPSLTERLENLDRAGFDVASLVQSAAAKGPLRDDHPAAALWWRILDELPLQPPRESQQPKPAVARYGI